MKPKIGKFPIEIFGHVYTNTSKKAIECRNKQLCPYINKECTKPRKSEPDIKVGICSVGYKSFSSKENIPVAICPNRFLDEKVFKSIENKFCKNFNNTRWIKEVNIGVGGNIDYVAASLNENNKIEDFLCVEFQTNGTTGSPYGYVKDLFKYGKYSSNYKFGLNWATEFVKTMMQQAYKKGKIVEEWNKKIVFVIQDISMDYLEKTVDTSGLREDINDTIHFMTYKFVWNDKYNKFDLEFDKWKSTNLEGINKLLGGANKDKYLTSEQFIDNITSKGKIDEIIE